jgi:CubicO group peptidase (beta-lactamase class C family)
MTGPPQPLDLEAELADWPGHAPAGAAVVGPEGVLAMHNAGRSYRWASITKLLTALVVLDAAERGEIDLDEPAGPPGSTVQHLLAHASGLAVEDDRTLAPPGRRRIYSNRGYEVLAAHAEERLGGAFSSLLAQRVLDPFGMLSTWPAHGARGTVGDLAILAHELLRPQAIPGGRISAAAAVAFPGLSGVLPGYGRQEPNDWGLGFERRGRKQPHWTGPATSPETFGHFGQSGAFLWVDPAAGLACVAAADTAFGPWAADRWPRLSAAALEHYGRDRNQPPISASSPGTE